MAACFVRKLKEWNTQMFKIVILVSVDVFDYPDCENLVKMYSLIYKCLVPNFKFKSSLFLKIGGIAVLPMLLLFALWKWVQGANGKEQYSA